MKRLIISITIIVLVVLTAQASRALTEPVTISQPDGTTVTIILNGDVHCNWLTTTDGMMLVEINKGYYVATIDDSGKLQATRQLAHNAQQRLATEQQLFQEQQSRKALFFDRAKKLQQQGRRAQIANSDYFPHMGQPKTLVILANFSDVKFTSDTPQRLFEQYFNGETTEGLAQNGDKNLTTVHRYFELCSHGKFNPQFVVVGPVDLPQTMEYYGASEEGSSDDANFSQFCNDVISAVDNEVNFNDYDNDGDGKAELVCVVYAGYGQNISGNPANSIWPKCGYRGITTTDTYAKDNSQNVTVSYMNCCAELFRMNNDTDLNGIGTFVHEFSHGMGLPDLYATVSSAQINNQTPEFWDLMDYGEHANNGYAPVPYTAWEQETMGWIEVETLTNTQNVTDMLPLLQGGKAYKFGNGSNSEEWMYLENVQSRDATNKIPGYAYGHGLLVSHVAYNKSTVSMGDYPNNTAGTPLISIVPADGLVINGYQFGDGKPYTQEQYTNSLRGDTYPGTSTITTLSDSQNLPNYKFYSGDSTPHFCLKNIAEDTSTGAVSFDFDNDSQPYARLENDELVFMYDGNKTDNDFAVTTFNSPEDRAWHQSASSIKGVRFAESFIDYSPTSTAFWFYGMEMLEALDLSSLTMTNVTNTSGMFTNCSLLATITVNNTWPAQNGAEGTITPGGSGSSVTGSDMFNGCRSLKGGAGTTYDASHVDYTYAHIDGGESNPGYFTAAAGNAEPYAVLSDNNTVMTFFYDDQKTAKGGMDVGPFDYYSKERRGWSPYTSQITKAVFDLSFDQCTTLTSTAFWFIYMTQLETIEHIEYLHTDNVEDMCGMFDSCYVLRDLEVSHFVTAKVKNMECMFNRCESLTSLDLRNFDTSSCTFMRGMFFDCKSLTSLDITNFDTSKNTSTESMFELCSSLTSLDLSHFSTESVTDMSYMFNGCEKLTSLDLSSFNTSGVKEMDRMFKKCSSLTSINFGSGFNTQNVTNMVSMFGECKNLTSLDLRSFNTENVTNMRLMFDGCSSLTALDLSSFNTQNVTDLAGLFQLCSGLKELDLERLNTDKASNIGWMFNGCSSLRSVNISSFNTVDVTDMTNMFKDCSSLASIQAGNAVIADSIYAQIENPNLLLYVNEASQTPQSVRNVVVLDEAEQIVLTDTEQGNNNFFCPKQFTAKRISYTHNYKQATQVGVSRGWETIALPFSVQTITHEKNGTLVPFGVDGGKPFWLRELTENGLVSAQRIEAYVPYLISMPNNSIYPADYNQAGNVTFSATDAVVAVTEQRSASGNNRTLIPTCQRVGQSASVYAINLNEAYESNAEGSIFVANYREVRPFEAYVEHPNGGARYYTLGDLADMDVTSLQAIHNIVASDFVKVYNLSGVLVKSGKRHEVIPYLTKGVYIINGSKVVIK